MGRDGLKWARLCRAQAMKGNRPTFALLASPGRRHPTDHFIRPEKLRLRLLHTGTAVGGSLRDYCVEGKRIPPAGIRGSFRVGHWLSRLDNCSEKLLLLP